MRHRRRILRLIVGRRVASYMGTEVVLDALEAARGLGASPRHLRCPMRAAILVDPAR
uniref:Uncharacterized protein n=1 Tax=Arthrobacter sp. JBH1 TaxID=723551 RepID=I1Y9H0_9MICC|nr:hypothetical protein [Arthrobacter sp. JBH1]